MFWNLCLKSSPRSTRNIPAKVPFPIIDAIYRILRDDEYRALAGGTTCRASEATSVILERLLLCGGFETKRRQTLPPRYSIPFSFLWQSRLLDEADIVTETIIEHLQPLSITYLWNQDQRAPFAEFDGTDDPDSWRNFVRRVRPNTRGRAGSALVVRLSLATTRNFKSRPDSDPHRHPSPGRCSQTYSKPPSISSLYVGFSSTIPATWLT